MSLPLAGKLTTLHARCMIDEMIVPRTVLDRFRLDGRTAMITGGSRGLGRAMAQALAEAGADLILVGREADALELARAELGALGRAVDVLVNNVGGRRVDIPTEDVPIAEWQRLFDLNLTSALVCCQKIGRGM